MADGKCAICGVELRPGWHADHVTPWSKGGSTDVVNGQALCPECNLKKGAKMNNFEMRPWQKRFIGKLEEHNNKHFLLVATPASGKTYATAAAANLMMNTRRDIDRVLIVAPTVSVLEHFEKTFELFGISIDSSFEKVLKNDRQGLAVTYQAIGASLNLYRHLLSRHGNWMIIFDEVHHLSDEGERGWSESAIKLFEQASFCLSLSGTPFRSDRTRIPFIRYEVDPETKQTTRCAPDFEFTYDEAVRVEKCVRKVFFKYYGCEVSWREIDGSERIVTFNDDLNQIDCSKRLRHALDSNAQNGNLSILEQMILDANTELQGIRKTQPRAGGMVLCMDSKHANKVASVIERLLGVRPVIVHSGIPGAAEEINRFRNNNEPWMVSVQMVSEGTDIPRLQIGVYATNITTELFFRQAVGRFIRAEDGGDAIIYHLEDPTLKANAERYAKSVDAAVMDEVNEVISRSEYERDSEGINRSESLYAVGELTGVIVNGDSIDKEEWLYAERVAANLKTPISVDDLYHALKACGTVLNVNNEPSIHSKPTAPTMTKTQREAKIRKEVSKTVNRIAYKYAVIQKDIYIRLNEMCGINSVADPKATVETLEQLLKYALQWFKTGEAPR